MLQGYLVQKAKVLRLVGQVGLDLRRRVMGGREVDGSFVCVGHYGISLIFVKDAILNVVYYPLVWGLTGCRNGLVCVGVGVGRGYQIDGLFLSAAISESCPTSMSMLMHKHV